MRGNCLPASAPDEVFITSLFTYWAAAVWESVHYYKQQFPEAPVTVGGIYASLAPDHCAQSGCDRVYQGVHQEAEACPPDYTLVQTEYQIVSCVPRLRRRCRFCGTYKIEPQYVPKDSVLPEIVRRHLVFYDNNLLANPKIDVILDELAEARFEGRRVTSECQSGFDGRLLTPDLARRLKAARFRSPRICMGWSFPRGEGNPPAGYDAPGGGVCGQGHLRVHDLHFDISPEEMHRKAERCFRWGVQVADCRYRPLDRFSDGYNPRKKSQEAGEYYLHDRWRDADVRGFRRAVRENNICLRYGIQRSMYDKRLEGLRRDERSRLVREMGLPLERRLTVPELSRLNEFWLAQQLQTRRTQGGDFLSFRELDIAHGYDTGAITTDVLNDFYLRCSRRRIATTD